MVTPSVAIAAEGGEGEGGAATVSELRDAEAEIDIEEQHSGVGGVGGASDVVVGLNTLSI